MSAFLRRLPFLLVALSVAFLSGCAQIKRQAFNAAAAPHIKSLVVARAQNQDEYSINIVGHPGLSFGLIGGLIAAADMHSKTVRFTKAVDPLETKLQERFGERLADRLKSSGYETQLLALPKDSKTDQAYALSKQKTGSDAALLIDLGAGYWAAGPSTDYFPRVIANVKAVDIKTDKVLYEDTFTYGYAIPNAQTVHLASEPTYRFKDMDELVADPVKARAGLYAGLDALAQHIADDLKKP